MKVVTLKYLFMSKDMEDGRVGVKYVTDTEEAHKEFQLKLKSDDSILGCVYEYISEVEISLTGVVTTVKPMLVKVKEV